MIDDDEDDLEALTPLVRAAQSNRMRRVGPKPTLQKLKNKKDRLKKEARKGSGHPAPKKNKTKRNAPQGGWAEAANKKIRHTKQRLILHWAIRDDLRVLDIRVALYLLLYTEFENYEAISSSELAKELGAHANHVSTSLVRLAKKRIIVTDRKNKPYGYKLVPY